MLATFAANTCSMWQCGTIGLVSDNVATLKFVIFITQYHCRRICARAEQFNKTLQRYEYNNNNSVYEKCQNSAKIQVKEWMKKCCGTHCYAARCACVTHCIGRRAPCCAVCFFALRCHIVVYAAANALHYLSTLTKHLRAHQTVKNNGPRTAAPTTTTAPGREFCSCRALPV